MRNMKIQLSQIRLVWAKHGHFRLGSSERALTRLLSLLRAALPLVCLDAFSLLNSRNLFQEYRASKVREDDADWLLVFVVTVIQSVVCFVMVTVGENMMAHDVPVAPCDCLSNNRCVCIRP